MKNFVGFICFVLLILSTTTITAQHKFDCPDCRGKGEVVKPCPNPKCHNGAIFCEKCDYSGNVTHQCEKCKGSGVITKYKDIPCPYCHGEKGFEREKQEKCPNPKCKNGKVQRPSRSMQNGHQLVEVDCSVCDGKGFVPVKYKAACRKCGGTGVDPDNKESYTVKCDACDGKGSVTETCSQCEGKGCYPCPTCNGYGNVREKCTRCNGTGEIYTN